MSLSSSAIRMEEKRNELRRRAKVDLDVKLDRTGKKDVIDKKNTKILSDEKPCLRRQLEGGGDAEVVFLNMCHVSTKHCNYTESILIWDKH